MVNKKPGSKYERPSFWKELMGHPCTKNHHALGCPCMRGKRLPEPYWGAKEISDEIKEPFKKLLQKVNSKGKGKAKEDGKNTPGKQEKQAPPAKEG